MGTERMASITPASRTSIQREARLRDGGRRAILVVAHPKVAPIRPSADITDSFLPGPRSATASRHHPERAYRLVRPSGSSRPIPRPRAVPGSWGPGRGAARDHGAVGPRVDPERRGPLGSDEPRMVSCHPGLSTPMLRRELPCLAEEAGSGGEVAGGEGDLLAALEHHHRIGRHGRKRPGRRASVPDPERRHGEDEGDKADRQPDVPSFGALDGGCGQGDGSSDDRGPPSPRLWGSHVRPPSNAGNAQVKRRRKAQC